MTVWNEAMYYFHVAPASFRKIFFVLKHYRKEQSLAAYYLKTHGHLVPSGVELWEYDLESSNASTEAAYQLWFDGRRPEAVARFRLAREVTADRTFIDQFLAAAPALVVQK